MRHNIFGAISDSLQKPVGSLPPSRKNDENEETISSIVCIDTSPTRGAICIYQKKTNITVISDNRDNKLEYSRLSSDGLRLLDMV